MTYILDYHGKIKRHSTGAVFTQTATVSLSNSVTETTLIGSGTGTVTLPADFFRAGTTLYFYATGYHSSTGNPTITIRVKFGSTTILTMTGTSGNSSSDTFVIEGLINCRTTGASGTAMGQGTYTEVHSNGLRAGSDKTSTTTINTTISNVFNITAQWGTANAGNNIHLTNLVLLAIS